MSKRAFLVLMLIYSMLRPVGFAQQKGQPRDGDQDEVVKITTNLVQIDAVVTDGDGRRVTDLRAEDFEIWEDERAQNVTNCSYISVETAAPKISTGSAVGGASKPIMAPTPSLPLRPEQVRRTIALVVDDLGLSFESVYYIRQALKKYVNEQLRPGDLAAIVRTSAGTGALQQFTTDKRQLLAAIERVRWYPFGRSGTSTFQPIELDPLARLRGRAYKGLPADATPLGTEVYQTDADVANYRKQVFSNGTLGAINYVVRGMQDLPGRKSVLLLSDGITIFNPAERARGSGPLPSTRQSRANRDQDNAGVLDSLRRLTDLANRASVVIYTIDARGLQTIGLSAQDDTRDLSPDEVGSFVNDRHDNYLASQDGLNYLAQQTGGFFIHDNNDIGAGIRQVVDDQDGYYLLGYRPDESTFDRTSGRRTFHHLSVKVKRPGLRVRTRTGFFGVTDDDLRAAPPQQRQQLEEALTSPFPAGDVRLRLTSLFGNEPKAGSLVRSLVHIDGQDLSFTDEPHNWHKLSFEIVAVTFGGDGEVIDKYGRSESMHVSDAAYAQARQHGLIYQLNVPIKKAGAYQMRVAVRDVASSRVGSANQFIEIPDLSKGHLAVSGVALIGLDDQAMKQLSSAESDSTFLGAQQTKQAAGNDALNPDPEANPAVRRFKPGMTVQYACYIYNAKIDEKSQQPDVRTQALLYRDGKLIYSGKVFPYQGSGQTDLKRLALSGSFRLDAESTPGEYILQILATDPQAEAKHRTATSWIDFEILPR